MQVKVVSAVVVACLVASLLVAVPPVARAAEPFDPGEIERVPPPSPSAEDPSEGTIEERPERLEEVAQWSSQSASTWLLDDGSYETELTSTAAGDGQGDATDPGAPVRHACIRTDGQPDGGSDPERCPEPGGVGSDNVRGVQRTLLQFDVGGVVPETAHVRRADLDLQILSTEALPDEVWAHTVSEDWAASASWTLRSADGEEWKTAGGTFSEEPVAKVVPGQRSAGDRFDLAGAVQDWVREEAANYGVLLKTPEQLAFGISMRYDVTSTGADRPTLRIVWNLPTVGRH